MVDVRFLCKGRLLLRVFKSYTILLLSSLTRMPVKYFILSFTVVAATIFLVSSARAKLQPPDSVQVQLDRLEKRIDELEAHAKVSGVKIYPKVNFLSIKDRKRILITGGAGFVGSHLVDALMLQGHEVTVADNFFTGRKSNVEHWVGHHNFEMINHDVVDPLRIEVDQIYHLASPASPPHYMYNPIKTIKTNTQGTLNLLGLAKRVRARFLMASTSEVYGDPEVHPQVESYWGNVNTIGPRACYDEGKRVAETMCYAYQKQAGVEVRVARIFNTYGPRMHMNDGRVVSNFIMQALTGKPLTIYGQGKQTRSFQYVSDLVDGLIKLMNSNYSNPVNLGNPEERTIHDFAKEIQQRAGLLDRVHVELVRLINVNIKTGGTNPPPIVNKAAATDDPRRRKPDISLAKRVLNWQPKVSFEEGIRRAIDYFRKELEKQQADKKPTGRHAV